jgi:hypothetical protein
MIHNMSILFFFYKSKINIKGTAPIFCRITIETKRKQFSTGIYIKEASWNNLAQKAKGTSKDAIHINNSLDTTRQKLNSLAICHLVCFKQNRFSIFAFSAFINISLMLRSYLASSAR